MTENTEANTVEAKVVNGFVAGEIGGNPAGVVLDADGLSESDMLSIAAKVGLSETAFVSRSKTEGFKLDFFTPKMRIAHCGHATIATFSYLAELGRVQEGVTSKETVDGPRKIIIKAGAAYMEQKAPVYKTSAEWGQGVTEEHIIASLGIAAEDIDARCAPILVNTGNSFIVIGVKSTDIMRSLQPDQAVINEISEKLDLIGYYVYTTDGCSHEHIATTRMFAPRYGIPEEAATGMAAGPLACLLFDHLGFKQERIVIRQGEFMQPASPSIITVDFDLENGSITGLMAGGYGKSMRTQTISY